MSKDPAFLFYPGDYLRDTQCLSEPVQVAYDRIMCEHMRNICITQQQLNFFTKRLTDDQKEELLMVLSKNDDGFYIDWVVDSIVKRRNYSESRRKNRIGSTKRTTKKDKKDIINISKSYDKHMENENEIENIVNYLNEKTSKNFKSKSRVTKDKIKARINEGFNIDDFKKVIDVKVSQWKDDPNMDGYLRPETLFGNKFESYLNEEIQQKKVFNPAL